MEVFLSETEQAIAEGQKALKQAKRELRLQQDQKRLEDVERQIVKIRIAEKLTIVYSQSIGGLQKKSEVNHEDGEVDLTNLQILLNQNRDAVIDGMGLDRIWSDCDILAVSIKYDGSAIASAAFSVRSELLQASITTKYLKVVDRAIDQVQLEEITREALLILDGGRSMFEQTELFSGEAE